MQDLVNDPMRFSLTASVFLHVAAIVALTLGNPFLTRDDLLLPPPPPIVEILDISKITQTDKVGKAEFVPEDSTPEPPGEAPEKPPAAPVNTSSEPITPPVLKETPPEPRQPRPPEPIARPKVTPRPPPPRPQISKPEAAPKTEENFSSVLKNLVGEEAPAPKTVEDDALSEATREQGVQAPLGERLTLSEQDALRVQLERCWHVPIGSRDAEDLIVDIRLVVNPDRTVREARIVDQSRYNRDSFFRAAAEAALRAIKSPHCSPLALPPEKYDQWNVITVTFNPKDLF